MKQFDENVYEGIDRAEAIEKLTELTGIACVNAVVNASGEAEVNENDAGCYWSIIALCEAVLDGMPEEARDKGREDVKRIMAEHIECLRAVKEAAKSAREAAERIANASFKAVGQE